MALDLKWKFTGVLFLSFSSLLSAAPRLSLSTNTIATVNTTPGLNGPAQTVQASNTGDGSLNLTATASASWLAATLGAKGSCTTNGGNCYTVTIALNTATLAAGTYTEFITLTDPAAVDSPQDISVTVNSTGVQSSLTAYVTPTGGGTGSTALFNIFTTGTGVNGVVNTQSGGLWLSFLSGTAGIVPSPSPWLIQVAAQVGQVAGTYTGTVVISGSSVPSDNKTINVTMIVTAGPIIQLNNSSTIRVTGSPSGAKQFAAVTLNNVGGGTLTVTGATGSSAFLTASVTSPNTLLITADPAGLSTGVSNGVVTITSNAANNAQVSIPVELVVAPAGVPQIFTGGIINISTYAQEAMSVGDIGAIFGSQFAANAVFATASSVPLPTTLGSAQVLVNGVPAPLFFVSPGQINFQVPYSLNGNLVNTVQVVANGTPGNLRSVAINGNAPRLLTKNGAYGAIVNAADGSLVIPTSIKDPAFATHPAKPGDTIVIYAIGFGQTSPVAVEGRASNSGGPGSPLQTIGNVTVTFGGGFFGRAISVTPAFVGLTPTAAGLYQINVAIPSDSTLGPAVPVSVVANGVQSNAVNLAISTTGN
jgi:uncharacterized protein (TIGR03437 family)